MTPRQDSLTDQMQDLVDHAREQGMYDAVDWIEERFKFYGRHLREVVESHRRVERDRGPTDFGEGVGYDG